MKTMLEVANLEWRYAYAKALDTYLETSAELSVGFDFSRWFKSNVADYMNLDLDTLTPQFPNSLDSVISEIRVLHFLIENLPLGFSFEQDNIPHAYGAIRKNRVHRRKEHHEK